MIRDSDFDNTPQNFDEWQLKLTFPREFTVKDLSDLQKAILKDRDPNAHVVDRAAAQTYLQTGHGGVLALSFDWYAQINPICETILETLNTGPGKWEMLTIGEYYENGASVLKPALTVKKYSSALAAGLPLAADLPKDYHAPMTPYKTDFAPRELAAIGQGILNAHLKYTPRNFFPTDWVSKG